MILKVTWNATTDAGTWVVLNDGTGEVMGAVQIEGKPPEQRSPRNYEVFGAQIGVPPEGGTVEAGIVDDAQVLELWVKHQGAPSDQHKEESNGARAPG